MEFFPEMHITQGQAETIARGMMAVARAEGGVHPHEWALIKSFYDEAAHVGQAGSANHLAALENAPDIDPAALATGLAPDGKGGALAELFLKTTILLAYADGSFAQGERILIERYAKALGTSAADLARLEQSVKEYLLGHVSRLANVDAARKVARKLGA